MKNKYIILFFVILGVSLIFSCQSPSSGHKYDQLLDELAQLDGEFVYDSTLNDYSFNKKMELELLLQEFDDQDSLVKFLFENLDNERATNSLYKGKKIVIGNLSYQALTQTIYYEPVDEDGDSLKNWAGYIPAYSELEKLRLAKDKWQAVIDNNTYIFQ